MRISDWSSDVCSSDLRVATFFEVAWGASRGDIFPGRSPALPPRNDMIEGQIVGDAAILAGKFIAKEKIESCEGRVFGWLHILLQRDDRRNLHGPAWAVDFPFIAGDDIHTF